MECEICGKTLKGEHNLIHFEGSKTITCNACAGLGEPIQQSSPARESARNSLKRARTKESREVLPEIDEGLNIRHDCPHLIKTARETKGLTIDDLARQLFEKSSVLHKVETGKTKPTLALLEKLEKALNVKLRED